SIYWKNKISKFKRINEYIKMYSGSRLTAYHPDKDPNLIDDEYSIVEVSNLPIPNINIIGTMVKNDGLYEYYSSDVRIDSTADGHKVEVLYDYISDNFMSQENEVSELFTYNPGAVIPRMMKGTYDVTSRSYITYEGINYYSESATKSFKMVFDAETFIAPHFSHRILSNNDLVLSVHTNGAGREYTYRIVDNANNTPLSYKEIGVKGTSHHRYEILFPYHKKGVFVVRVDVDSGLYQSSYYYTVIVGSEPSSSIENGELEFHTSTNVKTPYRYNNALFTSKLDDMENEFYKIEFRKNDGRLAFSYVLASGYKIPIYDKGVARMITAHVDDDKRDHLHDPEKTGDADPFNSSPLGHKLKPETESSVGMVDNTSVPTKPTIRLSATHPSDKFYPDGRSKSVAFGDITITATNGSSDYNISILVDGKYYPNGTKFTKMGTHSAIVIYEDKFNYNINTTSVIFQVTGPEMYSPISIDRYPLEKYKPSYTFTPKFSFTIEEEENII